MITSAKIENFKGFKSLELPDLARITLLGGKNNVGKTAVLEALFLFYDRNNAGMFFRHLSWRGASIISPDPETACAPLFNKYSLEHKITLSIWEDKIQQTIEFAANRTYPQKPIEVESSQLEEKGIQEVITSLTPQGFYGIDITYQSAEKKLKARWSFIPKLDGATIQLAPETPEEYTSMPLKPTIFLGSRGIVPAADDVPRFGRLDDALQGNIPVEFLKIVEPRLKNLSIGSNQLIQGDIGIGRKIPVSLMGEGMGRLLSIILAIATAKDGVVLIDEIENGIHHSIMAQIWEAISKAACQFNCQIIATTHSYEFLQAAHTGVANAGMAEQFRYVRLDRRDDEVVAKTYTHEVLGAALESSWEVR